MQSFIPYFTNYFCLLYRELEGLVSCIKLLCGQQKTRFTMLYFSRILTANPPHACIHIFKTLLLVTTFFVMV